jgi:hypothetical protein
MSSTNNKKEINELNSKLIKYRSLLLKAKSQISNVNKIKAAYPSKKPEPMVNTNFEPQAIIAPKIVKVKKEVEYYKDGLVKNISALSSLKSHLDTKISNTNAKIKKLKEEN